MIALLFVGAVVVTAVLIGAYGVRVARTTSDFFVASRSIGPRWNASAICGEYLSAASFLGIAGLIMKYGVDMLWYPVGYAAGYLLLLLLVAAPLRRFGAYTIPDFAEGRLGSVPLRRVATVLVLVIGWFYLLPQLKGAGVTLQAILGTPYWVGVVVVAIVVTANVALGGMRGITFVQAFQYWVKVTAIVLPAICLIVFVRSSGLPKLDTPAPATFARTTTVKLDVSATFRVSVVTNVVASGKVDGLSRSGPLQLGVGLHTAARGARLLFPTGAAAPHVVGTSDVTGAEWSRPFGGLGRDYRHPVFYVYSLILATFLGTMGLPHILVRFYTNPDGRAARQTTLIVLGLLGVFYLFPAIYGVLGRAYAPDLFLTGSTDAVVLVLPGQVFGGLGGELLGGLVAAGAFAAFMSTASGLLISVAGSLTQDLLRGRVADFRWAAVSAGVVATVLALRVGPFDINELVGWAFAIAASSFCPLLVLGIWWRRLTAAGAAAGLIVGGGLSSAAILATIFGYTSSGWAGTLLSEPAAWSVPLAFATMVLVSRLTEAPLDVAAKMLALHTPESLGLSRNWRE